tara:strand:+ start:3817 stop:4503 length:687 start_codon:yes stop_codon:yes gene_type:complete
MSKFFSLIPARIGSKGIPKKNLYPLCNKPLVQWTIESSQGSKYISETIVSSDSKEILNLSKSLGVNIHKRNKSLSDDHARSEDVVLNVLDELEYLNKKFEYLVLLQPTSPLRNMKHIDLACEKIIEENVDSLISVKEVNRGVLKTLVQNDDGSLMSSYNKNFPFMPRQELPKAFMPNGAIYISKISSFIETQSFLVKDNSYILMDEQSSSDIDTMQDILKVSKLAEAL